MNEQRRELIRDLIRKHTRILAKKGLVAASRKPARYYPAQKRYCQNSECGKELPPHLARVCSGACFVKKPV